MTASIFNKKLLSYSMITTIIMFSIVMFYVNPSIDSHNGFSILRLQVAFDKELAINIVENWGVDGIEQFKKLIFLDYLYAISYSVFLSSLISYLQSSKNIKDKIYAYSIYLVFLAGFMDWMENTMELYFLNNMSAFSSTLFFIHSLCASIKWLALPIIVGVILILIVKKKRVDK